MTLSSDIALTAPNRSVEACNGVNYAYRRFGTSSADAPPLVMLQHFRGNLDDWDPLLLDALASRREVISVDNAGVGLSSGTVPRTDSGHGFLFQWPEQFAELVHSFLAGAGEDRAP